MMFGQKCFNNILKKSIQKLNVKENKKYNISIFQKLEI